MKKVLKIFLFVICFVFIAIIGLITVFFVTTAGIKLDDKKLIDLERTITYYDVNGNVFAEQVNGRSICDIDNIPEHTLNAFIAIEDKRFFSHNGIDIKGLIRAGVNNVKSASFKEGASTISQQLIKNTHLSSEKTIKRKLTEIKLSYLLEKKYSKRQILEKYLNTIYFGDNCYGINSAANHYFNKSPDKLSINESAFLAGVIKAPSVYSPYNNYDKSIKRKNLVLKNMHEQGYITAKEYHENINEILVFTKEDNNFGYGYLYMANKQLNELINRAFYGVSNLKVYTNYDKEKQKALTENLLNQDDLNVNKSGVAITKDGKVCAYYSTCGNAIRQMGSVFKPIMVYAPAIENNVVYSMSKIYDERCDFNGYAPKNYNEKYYGYVSVKESLAKSLNVCAVKLLNYTGVNKAISYVSKTDIPLTKEDDSLCLALGATKKGATLTQIVGAYSVFNNDGCYIKPSFIEKIVDDYGNIIYQNLMQKTKVFNSDTIGVVNDMNSYCVSDGTAKKLSFSNMNLYAKTGTVGNEKGNSDAYSISYNKDYILGVWYGAKENELMSNSITGGSYPTICSREIWSAFYKNKTQPSKIYNDDIVEKYIDKISYELDNQVVLADDNSPKRYSIKALFKKSNLPKTKSTRFTCPVIDNAEISVKNNIIKIRLCVAEYLDAIIYRDDGVRKEIVYDTKNKSKAEFNDYSALLGKSYCYSIVPYFVNGDKKFVGNEIKLNEVKIDFVGCDDWWRGDEINNNVN